ncbi:MAG: GGDEF domain-containing protein [Bacilli bacterium]
MKRKVIVSIVVCIAICTLIILIFQSAASQELLKQQNELENQFIHFRERLNAVMKNPSGKEERLIAQAESESDPLIKATYYSMAGSVYAIAGDINNKKKYSLMAIELYKGVPQAEQFVIEEYISLAHSCLRVDSASDALRFIYELLGEISNMDTGKVKEEVLTNTEVMLDVMLLNIYSTYGFEKEAREQFNKVENHEISKEQMRVDGEYINYSKFLYAELIEDYDAMEKYAYRFMEVTRQRTLLTGVDMTRAAGLNVAIAKVKKGKYSEAWPLLKDAEAIFIEMNDTFTLGATYEVFGEYYEGVNDVQAARASYTKALVLFQKLNVSAPEVSIIQHLLRLNETFGVAVDRTQLLERFYTLETKMENDSKLRSVVSTILKTNGQLNRQKEVLVEQKKKTLRERNAMLIGFVIFLATAVLSAILLVRKLSLEVKERKKSEAKLYQLANVDYLTGAFTKSNGYDQIKTLIDRREPFVLAIFDIDNFKQINDTRGHLYGDEVLRRISATVQQQLTENDTIIRFGGEEFIVLLRGKTLAESVLIIENCRLQVEAYPWENTTITISSGIAEGRFSEVNENIGIVDGLLYEAKTTGKNKVVVSKTFSKHI